MDFKMRFYTGKDERGCVGTICKVSYTNEHLCTFKGMGEAQQNPKDTNNYFIGRTKAFDRALTSMKDHADKMVRNGLTMPRDTRLEFWNIFLRDNACIGFNSKTKL